jgi:ribosomal protein S18 acetylase RimI-like enzyme
MVDTAQERYCCVAVLDGVVIGYGRIRWHDWSRDDDAHNAPVGWVLTGVVVSVAHRRRGVGRALAHHRLQYLEMRGAKEVWLFINSRNRASIALYTAQGFEEVSRDFAIPKVSFAGGKGILYRKLVVAR